MFLFILIKQLTIDCVMWMLLPLAGFELKTIRSHFKDFSSENKAFFLK